MKRTLINGVQIHKDHLGTTTYFYMGKIHREDGPAVISPNHQIWMIGGKVHREDGPAFLNIKEKKAIWYVNGVAVAHADFKQNQSTINDNLFESYIWKE